MDGVSFLSLKSRTMWRRGIFQTRNSLGRNKIEIKYWVYYTSHLSNFCLFYFLIFLMFTLLFPLVHQTPFNPLPKLF